MRLSRALSVLSPVVLVVGCDLITSAYQTGFDAGYNCVGAYYSCAAACEEQRQRRQEEVAVWEGSCDLDIQQQFADQPSMDAADEHCEQEHTFDSVVVVCDDVGQELDTEPNNCVPYDPPAFGVPRNENYQCPPSVSDGAAKRCLCCTGQERPYCDLVGGFCRQDADCCSGRCALDPEPEVPPDAGDPVPLPSGTCE